MGGCASSKYVTDEEKNKKKSQDKQKKIKENETNQKKNEKEVQKIKENDNKCFDEFKKENNQENSTTSKITTNFENKENKKHSEKGPTAKLEESDKKDLNEDEKKEITTYQTTVVKHSQKEGEELLQHLRNEAFKFLQNLFTKDIKNEDFHNNSPTFNSKTTIKISSTSSSNQSSSCDKESTDDIIKNVKLQVLESLGNCNKNLIFMIMDEIVLLIKDKKVKSMDEIQSEIEKNLKNEKDLVKKVINSATGYLTAKGTEAGVILSNILANSNTGIHGVMNETEKTTVKVTRTITEQFMNGEQLKDITKLLSTNCENSYNEFDSTKKLDEIFKNFTNSPSKRVINLNGSLSTSEKIDESEIHQRENDPEESFITKKKAEEVVSTAMNAAVEKVIDESYSKNISGLSPKIKDQDNKRNTSEDSIQLEEANTITFSTTKIILNNDNRIKNRTEEDDSLDTVQKEFYKNGKEVAEELIKTIIKTNKEE